MVAAVPWKVSSVVSVLGAASGAAPHLVAVDEAAKHDLRPVGSLWSGLRNSAERVCSYHGKEDNHAFAYL